MNSELTELKHSMWFNRGILLFLMVAAIANFTFNNVMYLGIEKLPSPDGTFLYYGVCILALLSISYLIAAVLGFSGIEIKIKRVKK